MQQAKVLITRKWPTSVEGKLKALYDVTFNEDDNPLTVSEFKGAFQQYDAICPSVCDSITAEILNVENRRCKILANFGVGFNHINITTAKKQIAGAGLDVYENEPNIDKRLLKLENISLLPHLGSATIATRTAMGNKVMDNLEAYFSNQPLPDKVI